MTRGLWELLRPPLQGLAGVLLLAVGAAIVSGQIIVWHNTVYDRDAQDFGIFLTSVRHAVAGRSLYTPTIDRASPSFRRMRMKRYSASPVTGPPNLNLPHTHLFLLPLAFVSTRTALRVWTFASFVVFVGVGWRSLRVLHWDLPVLAWLALAVYVLAWAPAAAFSLTAQVSLLLMGPVTAAWLAARSGRAGQAGAWLGLAAAIKPFLFLFVPYFLIRRDWAALRAMAIVTTVLVAAGIVVFGPGAYREWLLQLPNVSWAGHYLNASIFSVVERLFGRAGYGQFTSERNLVLPIALIGCALVATVTFGYLRRSSEGIAAIDREWAALLLASLLISPLGWSYYLWIAVWPVAASIGHAGPWGSRRPADFLLVPGLACWLWYGKMTEWGQPSPLATVTFASMYFWALLSLWLWCSIPRAEAHA